MSDKNKTRKNRKTTPKNKTRKHGKETHEK